VDDSFDVCLEIPDCAPWAGRASLRMRRAPFFDSWDKGSFVKYGMDPQEARLRADQYLKAQIGVRIGVKKRKELWGTLKSGGRAESKGETERGGLIAASTPRAGRD